MSDKPRVNPELQRARQKAAIQREKTQKKIEKIIPGFFEVFNTNKLQIKYEGFGRFIVSKESTSLAGGVTTRQTIKIPTSIEDISNALHSLGYNTSVSHGILSAEKNVPPPSDDPSPIEGARVSMSSEMMEMWINSRPG